MKHETFDWAYAPIRHKKDGQHLYLLADKTTEQLVYILRNQQQSEELPEECRLKGYDKKCYKL